MAIRGPGKRTISRGMKNRENFRHGNVSGKWFDKLSDVPTGKLPIDTTSDDHRGEVFVIFSYRTPIAWTFAHAGTEWTIPDVRYTVTTTNHQNVVRVCANHPGFYNDTRW